MTRVQRHAGHGMRLLPEPQSRFLNEYHQHQDAANIVKGANREDKQGVAHLQSHVVVREQQHTVLMHRHHEPMGRQEPRQGWQNHAKSRGSSASRFGDSAKTGG